MDRKEFLSSLGFSAASLMITSCLGSCKKSGTNAPTVDFTIDISQSPYDVLVIVGNAVSKDGVIIAKTLAGDIIAVAQACTHEGINVTFQANNNRFYCSGHGATFSTTGAVTKGPASSPLKQYTVTVNGNLIRING